MPKFSPVTCTQTHTHTHTHTHTQPAVTYCCLSPSTLSDIPHFLSPILSLALSLALSFTFCFRSPVGGSMQGNHALQAATHSHRDKNTRSLCGSTVLWKVLAYKGFQQFVGRIMRRYEGIGLSDQRLHHIDFYSHRMSFSRGDRHHSILIPGQATKTVNPTGVM